MAYSSISNNFRPLIGTRKVLASTFDFTPFLSRQQQQQRHKKPRRSSRDVPEPGDQAAGDHDDHHDENENENEIDPRYGVEKRRVPTGPNPLHH